MRIVSNLRLLALALVLLTLIGAGLLLRGYMGLVDSERRLDVETRVRMHAELIKHTFEKAAQDIAVIRALPSVRGIVDGAKGEAAAVRTAMDSFADELQAILGGKPAVLQARLISAQGRGREVVRVHRVDGKVMRAPEAALQFKGHRAYMQAALETPWPEVYYSRIELNREHNALEFPYVPTLRVASVILDPHAKPWGIVILNLSVTALFRSLSLENTDYGLYLANQEGDFLVHPDPSKTFGFEFGQRHRIGDDMPELARALEQGSPTVTEQVGPMLVSFHRLNIRHGTGRSFLVGTSLYGTGKAVGRVANNAAVFAVGVLAFAVLSAGGVAWRVVSPLEQMTNAVSKFRRERNVGPLPVSQYSEIRTLARTFQAMAAEVEEKERLLQQANRNLEHFARMASHDLREPARRVATLTDLLLVEEGSSFSPGTHSLLARIQAAADTMLGQIAAFRQLASLDQNADTVEPCALDALIETVLRERADAIQSRAVVVKRDSLPTVVAHRELLLGLYRNLVGNVLDHARGTGLLLHFTCTQGEDGPILGVLNTGSSIPPEKLALIFSPFVSLGTVADHDGLGLAIAHRIVDLHRGRIWAETTADSVHIQFTLPGQGGENA